MSAPGPGNMRGPRVRTPALLLLLLLLTPLLRTVSCQDYDPDNPEEQDADENPEEEGGGTEVEEEAGVTDPPPDPDASSLPEPSSSSFTTLSPDDVTDDPGSGDPTNVRSINDYGGDGSSLPPDGTGEPPIVDDGLGLIIIVIPVALVAVIIAVICGIFMHRRLNNKGRSPDAHTEEPYFEGSSTEKVPMPMFEEDVPSVLELEMEELDQWMKKDGDSADHS